MFDNNKIEYCKINEFKCCECKTRCIDKSEKYRNMLNRFLNESSIGFMFYHVSGIEKCLYKDLGFAFKYEVAKNTSWQKSILRRLKKVLKYANLANKHGNNSWFNHHLNELHGIAN